MTAQHDSPRVDTWRTCTVVIGPRVQVDEWTVEHACTLHNSATGVTVPYVFRCGSGHNTTAHSILSTLATYPMYVFRDGTPEHGVQPYCRTADTTVQDEPWCESLEYDPDDPASRGHHGTWMVEACKAVLLLSDDLDAAYQEEE